MVVRFCLYSIFKNLRFFEAFFLFYLLSGPELGGVGLSYFSVGALVGYLADSFGLPWAFVAISILLAAANLVRRG